MGEDFFFYCHETMWLIDYSEGEGVGEKCVPSHATYRNLLFDTLRFTYWTNKGNAIMSSTGTATFYLLGEGGEFQGPPLSV